ncbi:MAG: SurA N-terminal domain-containing protein [Desulfovibrio fairfieldensis]
MKKTFILLLAIWLCGVCGVQAAQLNKVAAVVNGQVITMFDLQKTALPELGRARLNPNNPAQAKEVDKVFRKVLDMMIMDILLGQEAKRLKISVSPSEVDNEIAKMMKARNLTKQQFEAQLAQQKISIDEIRQNFEKSLLRQKIM